MSETGNLESQLMLKIGAQVMLTSNLDIDGRLVYSLVGTVKQIKCKNNEVSVVYMKLNAGREAMQPDATAQQHIWVPPIKKHQALFGLCKNNQQSSVKRTQFNFNILMGMYSSQSTRSQFG